METKNAPEKTEASAEADSGSKLKSIIIGLLIFIILILTGVLFYFFGTRQGNEAEKSASPVQNAPVQPSPNIITNTVPQETTAPDEGVGTTVPVVDTAVKEPDLYIVSYWFSETPKAGEDFKVWIKIGNKGNADAGAFQWEWWPSSSDSACDGRIDSLGAGLTKTVGCDYKYDDWETYTTKAIVDSRHEVDESNEYNNVVTRKVTPTHEGKPDLTISHYSYNHDPKMGEQFTVSITIKNKGDGDADEFWWEWWPTSHGQACRHKIDSLDPGESDTVTCDYTYGGWANYTVKAVADADDDVDESNEGNNTHSENLVPIH